MYRYPEMKEFYLIMDNSPINDKKISEIEKITESRDYHCGYIPPYFPFLKEPRRILIRKDPKSDGMQTMLSKE